MEGIQAQACHNCWFANGAWHEEATVSGSYRALGSIDGVAVPSSAYCDEDGGPVSIRAGDRVDFTWTMRVEYRYSPSPQELGYREFGLIVTPWQP